MMSIRRYTATILPSITYHIVELSATKPVPLSDLLGKDDGYSHRKFKSMSYEWADECFHGINGHPSHS